MQIKEYLESFITYPIKPGLERIRVLLAQAAFNFKIIHITGTNGKGSTAYITCEILKLAGYKVGLYTSPHLICVCERIKIDGKNIPHDRLAKILTQLTPKIRELQELNDPPTYFEVLTAVGLIYFSEECVDIAVIEVGLGGALDATNIVPAEIGIITNISYDHTDILGPTLDHIAKEKYGIIKKGMKVISTVEGRLLRELEDACHNQSSTLYLLNRDFFAQVQLLTPWETTFWMKTPTGLITNIKMPLLGSHQVENAACAIAATYFIDAKKVIDEKVIKEALQGVFVPARAQLVREDILLDSAHNQAGFSCLVDLIKECFSKRQITIVLGLLKDKDKEAIAKVLAQMENLTCIVTTEPNYPKRKLPAQDLYTTVKGIMPDIEVYCQPQPAAAMDFTSSRGYDMLVVAGSFYLLSEVLLYLHKQATIDDKALPCDVCCIIGS